MRRRVSGSSKRSTPMSRCPSGATASASPTAFRAGRKLVEAGVPLDDAIAQSSMIAKAVQPIAHQLVMLVADQLLQDPESAMPGDDSGHEPAIVGVAQRLRPLAGGVVAEELTLAMDDEIRKHLKHLIDRLLVETGQRGQASDDAATEDEHIQL